MTDFVGDSDRRDVYRFNLNTTRNFNLTLNGMSADADVYLYRDSNGDGVPTFLEQIEFSDNSNDDSEEISTTLQPGTYFVAVVRYQGDTYYNLTLSAT